MITLPHGFTPVAFAGYFWHLKEQKLYSIKSGILKPLKIQRNKWTQYILGWNISHKGHKVFLAFADLQKLTLKDYVIPKQRCLF